MRIDFFIESFKDRISELEEMWQQHWDEVGYENKRIEFAPHYSKYIELERLKMIQFVVARDETEKAIGYCLDIVSPHLHHKFNTYAVNDVLYVVPEHRKSEVPMALLKNVQNLHRDNGVTAHFITMMKGYGYEKLAKAAGYSEVETNWAIYLQE